MGVNYVSREELEGVVASKVQDADSVLDIGPGIRPQQLVDARVHICVDAHRPYLERLKRESGDDPKYVLINAAWDQFIGMLPDKTVDTVFAVDVIEHMKKEDGFRMLREAERVARQQVVIFTPLGFYPQSYDDETKPDRWGMDGGYWQTHRSGWEPQDFGEQWDLACCRDFHLVGEDEQPLEEPIGAIWAIRNLGASRAARPARRRAARRPDHLQSHAKKLLRKLLPPRAYNSLRSIWHGGRRH
jgi:hypothetical protein